jgi:hypothetical protein
MLTCWIERWNAEREAESRQRRAARERNRQRADAIAQWAAVGLVCLLAALAFVIG